MIYQFFFPFKRCSLWKFAQTVHDLKGFFFCCNYHISLTMRTSNWKWNLDHAIVPLTLKRWITIASTIWCTLYISFLLKKNIVYSFVETQTSLSRNKMGNKYNHVCVLMSTGYRHLKHVKKRLKTPESASYMDPFQKSAGLQ